MNLKTVSLSAATATVVATGIALAGSSANAAVLANSVLAINGNARLELIGGNNWKLNFANFSAGTGNVTVETGSTGSFTGLVGSNTRIRDLSLTKSDNTWTLSNPSSSPFLQLSNGVQYLLNTFTLTRTSSGPFFLGTFDGTFFDPSDNSSIASEGLFSSQGRDFLSKTGTTFSATVTAVPTPALLPGLIGLGVAAWRKRRSEDEQTDSEA
jgi:hypothetical protein